jgi:hypothetical protein
VARQHATPVLLGKGGGESVALQAATLAGTPDLVSEDDIQRLVHEYPSCLPIAEIDLLFRDAVPICRELITAAGAIDNLLMTPTGLPVLVECKLWRNPQGRREVVGQILDYAKELARWSSSDLQREVRKRIGGEGDPVMRTLREWGHDPDEIEFNDALTANLRRGRFLLLIIGDGIREGVEAIADYLQTHAGLHFSLGLVEMPIYYLPDGARLVVPRILARTHVITRSVVQVPEGMQLNEPDAEGEEALDDLTRDRLAFWREFVAGLDLDDPEQPTPKPGRQGYVSFMLPAPLGSCWITVFRNLNEGRVGLFLSYTRGTIGERAVRRVIEDWESIQSEIGGSVRRYVDRLGRDLIQDDRDFGSLITEPQRAEALRWLRDRSNAFVNAFRPRIRAAVADLLEEG